jgi:dTMP kinase
MYTPARGRLITIEGIDGAGKTSVAQALLDALRARGIDVVLLREPGGVELSERVRALVKDPALTVGARAEALLYAAARAQLVEESVGPRLAAGTWVLLDRFVDSSLAYQGAGRGLGVEPIRQLNRFATGDLEPDRTLLLSLRPALARARAHDRAGAPPPPRPAPPPPHDRAGAPDRLEREDERFFERIADAYLELARLEPSRIATIDAGGTPAQVLEQALDAIADLLDQP